MEVWELSQLPHPSKPKENAFGRHTLLEPSLPRFCRVRQVYIYILMIMSSKGNRGEKDDGKQRRLLNALQDIDIQVGPKKDRPQFRHV